MMTGAYKEGERGGEEGLGEGKEQTRKDRATQPFGRGRLR